MSCILWYFKVGFYIHNRRLLVPHSEPAASNPYPWSGKTLSNNTTYTLSVPVALATCFALTNPSSGPNTRQTAGIVTTWQETDDGLMNPKHVANAFEREYVVVWVMAYILPLYWVVTQREVFYRVSINK